MTLLEIKLEHTIIFSISVMLLLFLRFVVALVVSQRRKLQYHQNLHALQEEQKQLLQEQNAQLEIKVQERTRELSVQKEELQKSLLDLKTTQLQLIQREKMASLGELTAGIAHEIQNPLNFINNFSDISVDMLGELEECIKAGRPNEALEIIDQAKTSLQKIAHHGKRADAIIKNMLEHSRRAGSEKELTDINTLTEEYLKLAYQVYTARDNRFAAIVETRFDHSLRKINVMPQEIGRVLVNLFNNAFYSVQEKKRQQNGSYEPVVQVSTRLRNAKLEISVKDNGTGIPEKLLAKIYQPFFTTKPTGEGTGLGLSLSYDVVTKGHGGNLSVVSKEGEGAEFVVQLPIE